MPFIGFIGTSLAGTFVYADEYITMKQLAAIRFHRNHRLMAEIFNDIVVPTARPGMWCRGYWYNMLMCVCSTVYSWICAWGRVLYTCNWMVIWTPHPYCSSNRHSPPGLKETSSTSHDPPGMHTVYRRFNPLTLNVKVYHFSWFGILL